MTTFIQEQPRELEQAHSVVMSEFDQAIAELRAANDWLRKHDEEPDFLSEELLEARYDLDALVARHESGSLTDAELREIENADFLARRTTTRYGKRFAGCCRNFLGD